MPKVSRLLLKCSGGSRGGALSPPPLFLDQTEARKASPLMVDPHPPLPLPLSQGLDPAQQCTYYRKVLLSSSHLNGHT